MCVGVCKFVCACVPAWRSVYLAVKNGYQHRQRASGWERQERQKVRCTLVCKWDRLSVLSSSRYHAGSCQWYHSLCGRLRLVRQGVWFPSCAILPVALLGSVFHLDTLVLNGGSLLVLLFLTGATGACSTKRDTKLSVVSKLSFCSWWKYLLKSGLKSRRGRF